MTIVQPTASAGATFHALNLANETGPELSSCVFGIPHLNGIVPWDSVKSNLVPINLAYCYDRHLSADANWLRMCDRNLSLVIDFNALIRK